MKRLLTLFIVSLCLINLSVFSQDIKINGFYQHWLTVEEQTPKDSLHPSLAQKNWGFRTKRASIGFASDLNSMFSVVANLELAYKDSPLLDFWGTGKFNKYFNARIGQFIPNCQIYEATGVPTAYKFYQLSDISLQVAAANNFNALRDVGLEVFGGNNIFKYYAYVGNGTGRFIYADGEGYVYNNITNRKLGQGIYGTRLDFTPIKGLRIGGHFAWNKQDSIRIDKTIQSLDRKTYSLGFATDDLLVKNLYSDFDYAGADINDYSFNVAKGKMKFYGIAADLGYKITREFHLLGRYEYYKEDYDNNKYKDATSQKVNIGASYFVFNGDKDIFKCSLNYNIKNEDPTEIDNNILVFLIQFKF